MARAFMAGMGAAFAATLGAVAGLALIYLAARNAARKLPARVISDAFRARRG